jgi:hypothetical protein
MKYFENLPKTTYETTIGDFTISDLTSYFTLDYNNLETAKIEASKNSTLVELSGSLYSDVNSFWLFLYANKTINPFTVCLEDTESLLTQYDTNYSLAATNNGGKDVIIPAGSIVYPAVPNSGVSWDYGSTGGFSLTGGFGYVQSFNSFTKIATILSPEGATFAVVSRVNFILKGDTYSYYFNPIAGVTPSINYYTKQKESVKSIVYKDSQTFEVYALAADDKPVISKGINPTYTFSGATQFIDYQNSAKNTITEIDYFLPYSVGYLNLTKVIQNYVV